MSHRFQFPDTVNETSARVVASGVVVMGVLYLATSSVWVLFALAYGFLARVIAGPTFSPLARFATQVVTPRIPGPHRLVAGAPKRFAQAIGATFSLLALGFHLGGAPTASVVAIAALVGAAGLEAFLSFCLGCVIFGHAMRLGLVPESVCEDCADISRRLATR